MVSFDKKMGATSSQLPEIQATPVKDGEESKQLSGKVVDEWRNHMFNMFSSFYVPIKTDVYSDVARNCKCPTFLKLWTYFMNGNTVNSDTLLLDYVYNELIADPVNAYSDGTGYSSNKLMSFDKEFDTFMASMSTYTLMKIVLLAFLSQYSTCPHNTKTFRRMRLESWDDMIELKGASFTSVSYELTDSWFGNYTAKVELRKGTRCIPRFLISDIVHPNEKEIIISPFIALCQKRPSNGFSQEFVAVDVNVEDGSPYDVLSYHDIKTIVQTKLIVGLLLRCKPIHNLSSYTIHEQFKQVTGMSLSDQLRTCRDECKVCFAKIRRRSDALLPRACKAIVGPPPIRSVKLTRSMSRGRAYTAVPGDRKWNTVKCGERIIDRVSLRDIFDSLCDPRVSIPLRITLKNAVRAGRDTDFLTPLVSEFRRFFNFVMSEAKADPFTPLISTGWSQEHVSVNGTFTETSLTLQAHDAIVFAQLLADWFFKFRTGFFWVKETSRSNRHLWRKLQKDNMLVRGQEEILKVDMTYMYCMNNNADMLWLQNGYVGVVGVYRHLIYNGSLTPKNVLNVLSYLEYTGKHTQEALRRFFSDMMNRSPAKEMDFIEMILTQHNSLALRLFYSGIRFSAHTFTKVLKEVLMYSPIDMFIDLIKALVKTQTKEYLDSFVPSLKKSDIRYLLYLTEAADEFSELKSAAFDMASRSIHTKKVAVALQAINKTRIIELIPTMKVSKYIEEYSKAPSLVAYLQTAESIIAYAKYHCFHTLEGTNFGDLAVQLVKNTRVDLLEDFVYAFIDFQATEDVVPASMMVCTRIGIRRIIENDSFDVYDLPYMSKYVVEAVSREILNTGSDDLKFELIYERIKTAGAYNEILRQLPVTETNTRILAKAISLRNFRIRSKLERCFRLYVARAPSRDQNTIAKLLFSHIQEYMRKRGIPFDKDAYTDIMLGNTSGKRKAKVSNRELYQNIQADLRTKKHNQYYLLTRESGHKIIVVTTPQGTMFIIIDLVLACRTQTNKVSSVEYELGVSSTILEIAREFVNEMFGEKPSIRYEFENVDDNYPSLRLNLRDDQIANKNEREFITYKVFINKTQSIMVWFG